MRNQQETAFERIKALGHSTEELADYIGVTTRQMRRYRTGETMLPLDVINGLLAHPDTCLADVIDDLVHHRTSRLGISIDCPDRPTAEDTTHAAECLRKVADFVEKRAAHLANDNAIDEQEHGIEIGIVTAAIRPLHCLYHRLKAAGFSPRRAARDAAGTPRLAG